MTDPKPKRLTAEELDEGQRLAQASVAHLEKHGIPDMDAATKAQQWWWTHHAPLIAMARDADTAIEYATRLGETLDKTREEAEARFAALEAERDAAIRESDALRRRAELAESILGLTRLTLTSGATSERQSCATIARLLDEYDERTKAS